MSIEKIYLKGINPTLPTAYDDGLSYMEAIAKLQYKINECIVYIQEADIEGLKKSLLELKQYVDSSAANVDNKLRLQLQEVNQLVVKTVDKIEKDISSSNSYNKKLVERALYDIAKTIEEKSLQVTATNPLSGELEPVNKVLGITDSICRNNALVAGAYDYIGLTADEFDEMCNDYDVSCFVYDVYGVIGVIQYLSHFITPNTTLGNFSYNVNVSPYYIDISVGSISGYEYSIIGDNQPTVLFNVGEKLSKLFSGISNNSIVGTMYLEDAYDSIQYHSCFPLNYINNKIQASNYYSNYYKNVMHGSFSDAGSVIHLNLININLLHSYNI